MTPHTAPSTERRVTVGLGDRAYDIVIKRGALAEVGERLTSVGLSGKAAVVTNPVVGRLYGATVLRSLKGAGFRTVLVTLPDGERHKTLRSVARVLDALAAARFERGST
ncbi:MAG: 3-dehydroquinate synthase, partial [Nitrospira sp.]